jgi:hypothetical protein
MARHGSTVFSKAGATAGGSAHSQDTVNSSSSEFHTPAYTYYGKVGLPVTRTPGRQRPPPTRVRSPLDGVHPSEGAAICLRATQQTPVGRRPTRRHTQTHTTHIHERTHKHTNTHNHTTTHTHTHTNAHTHTVCVCVHIATTPHTCSIEHIVIVLSGGPCGRHASSALTRATSSGAHCTRPRPP